MSRHLSQIDPNLPPLSSSTTPSPTDLLPSPSKEHPKPDTRMREWTFPSSKPQSTSTSSSPLNRTNNSHGRSSSISQSSNGSGNGGGGTSTRHHEPTLTKDLRHRSNFSLIHPGTPELSIPVPTSSSSPTTTSSSSSSSKGTLHSHSPSRAGGGGMSWKNRKRFNDFVYFVVFGGAFVLFSSSLFGVGYKPPLPSTTTSSLSDSGTIGKVKGILLENVEIAQGFKEKEGVPPADVYQSVGKLSREDQRGIEFVKDSPEDPSLDDENVHDTHHATGDSALFPHVDHPDELDSDELHDPHVENRPRPARLPIAHDEDDDVEGSRGSGHRHHAGHEEEHDSMEEGADEEYSFEEGEEEADDDEHGQEGDHEHSIDDEMEEEDGEEVVVDDTISIGGSPPRSDGQRRGGQVDELKDSEESLSALEELLLDADDDLEEEEEEEAEPLTLEEEEAQHAALQHRRPIVGGGDALERLRREREELGRARERWEARVREGLPDEDDGLEYEVEEDAGEGWQGSGELRHRRMIRRVRR